MGILHDGRNSSQCIEPTARAVERTSMTPSGIKLLGAFDNNADILARRFMRQSAHESTEHDAFQKHHPLASFPLILSNLDM